MWKLDQCSVEERGCKSNRLRVLSPRTISTQHSSLPWSKKVAEIKEMSGDSVLHLFQLKQSSCLRAPSSHGPGPPFYHNRPGPERR